MRKFKDLFFVAAVLVVSFAFTSCTDDDENEISQTIEMAGVKYQKVLGLYHQWDDSDEINFDIDTDREGDNNVHGYGYFDKSLVGKTVDLVTDSLFDIGFNFMNGGFFSPEYKSGSLTIKKVSKGYHIFLNSINEDDTVFKIDMLFYDEEEFFKDLK